MESHTDLSHYRSNIVQKLNQKNNFLQFLPQCLENLTSDKNFYYKEEKLKTPYLIDFVHTLMLKYYFKRENKFTINSIVLKERYGYLYKSYVDYLVDARILYLKQNYKAGVISRTYQLNEKIFKQNIKRINNSDKFLIKKYKKKIFDTIDFVEDSSSPIEIEVRQKLISDLYSVSIDYDRSMAFINSVRKDDMDSYNRNLYSIESINNKHIFYHFDNYGRLHTNFTILKSFVRKNCLSIDGEETCELDIKNSQPRFLAKLIQDSQTNWVSADEFELFKQLTIYGNFYQYLMQNTNQKVRRFIKESTYKVLFGHNRSNSKSDKMFSSHFPTIHHFIKLYKKEWGNHKILAHDLQRAESNLIFNKVVKKIMMIHPDIKIITVHDSLIFAKKWKEQVETIFNQELDADFSLN
jgi:hypothetical protein